MGRWNCENYHHAVVFSRTDAKIITRLVSHASLFVKNEDLEHHRSSDCGFGSPSSAASLCSCSLGAAVVQVPTASPQCPLGPLMVRDSAAFIL